MLIAGDAFARMGSTDRTTRVAHEEGSLTLLAGDGGRTGCREGWARREKVEDDEARADFL